MIRDVMLTTDPDLANALENVADMARDAWIGHGTPTPLAERYAHDLHAQLLDTVEMFPRSVGLE